MRQPEKRTDVQLHLRMVRASLRAGGSFPMLDLRLVVVLATAVGLVCLAACSDEGVAPPPPDPLPVSFAQDIQPIFDNRCVGCHVAGGQAPFLVLVGNQSYTNLVGVAATVYPGSQRVVASDPDASVLYNKIADTGIFGGVMPPVSPALPTDQVAIIRDWIAQGALDN